VVNAEVENVPDERNLSDRFKSKAIKSNEILLQNSSSSTFVNFGKLQPYLDDKSVEEIWINSPNRIFIARNGKSELAPIIISLQEIRDIAERGAGAGLTFRSPLWMPACLMDHDYTWLSLILLRNIGPSIFAKK